MSGDNKDASSGSGIADFFHEVYGDVVDFAIAREQNRTIGSNVTAASPPALPNAPPPAAVRPSRSLVDLVDELPDWSKWLLGGSLLMLVGATVVKLARS